MSAVRFRTIARPNDDGLLLVEVPERVMKRLGAGKRVPVRVTLNGAKYRSTIAVYADRYYLPARREIREAAKLTPGGRADVSLEVDTAARTVAVPPDLDRALRDARLRAAFDAASFTARREIVEGVTSAKRPATRDARIARGLARLRAKATHRSTT
ncbi:MAG TPA: YdeI/OmpD-associated family protein [Candidatus Limnocylindria bacterium]